VSKAKAKERRKKRSLARRRAETHKSGFSTTSIRIPDGMKFWKYSDVNRISIIPYVAGKGNPECDPGDLYYERTYWVYRNVGIEEKTYICSHKTFGKPDFIKEELARITENSTASTEQEKEELKKTIKALSPKERQLFLIYDHDNPSDGLQLWDFSYHQFGKLLDDRIDKSEEEDGWDLFYFADEDGMILRLTMSENKPYGFSASAIDFSPRRDPLPDDIVNHGVCLDDLLVETSYEELKNIYLGVPLDERGGGESSDKGRGRKAKKEEPENDDEPDDDTETEPELEEKPKPKPKPKKEKKAEPVAEDYGIEKDSRVKYKSQEWTVVKVSGDGTSLTLMSDDDEIEKAIGPDEVVVVGDQDDEAQPPFDGNDEDDSDTKEGGGDEWDEDWD